MFIECYNDWNHLGVTLLLAWYDLINLKHQMTISISVLNQTFEEVYFQYQEIVFLIYESTISV